MPEKLSQSTRVALKSLRDLLQATKSRDAWHASLASIHNSHPDYRMKSSFWQEMYQLRETIEQIRTLDADIGRLAEQRRRHLALCADLGGKLLSVLDRELALDALQL